MIVVTIFKSPVSDTEVFTSEINGVWDMLYFHLKKKKLGGGVDEVRIAESWCSHWVMGSSLSAFVYV